MKSNSSSFLVTAVTLLNSLKDCGSARPRYPKVMCIRKKYLSRLMKPQENTLETLLKNPSVFFLCLSYDFIFMAVKNHLWSVLDCTLKFLPRAQPTGPKKIESLSKTLHIMSVCYLAIIIYWNETRSNFLGWNYFQTCIRKWYCSHGGIVFVISSFRWEPSSSGTYPICAIP